MYDKDELELKSMIRNRIVFDEDSLGYNDYKHGAFNPNQAFHFFGPLWN